MDRQVTTVVCRNGANAECGIYINVYKAIRAKTNILHNPVL
jgi:hypothetical protein